MSIVQAKCLMCGKTMDVAEDHKDYSKLASQQTSSFICDICNNRIRFESDEQRKPKKPM